MEQCVIHRTSIEEERRTTVMLGRDTLPEPPTQLLTSAIDHPSRQTEKMPARDPAGSAQEMDSPTRRLCPQLGATAIFRQRHDSVPNGEGRGFQTRMNLKLREDVLNVGPHRVSANTEFLG
jgi:hypothetical protein